MKTLLIFVLLLPGLVTAQQMTFDEHTGHGITGIQGIMISADVNNNGIDDIFVSGFTNFMNGTYGGAILYLGNGNGGFTPAPNQPFITNQFISNAQFVHYNGDNHIDLVVVEKDINTNQVFISVLLNDGNGNFTPTYTFEVDGEPVNASIRVADLDNDGDMDILVSVHLGPNNYETRIYSNDNNVFTKLSTSISGFSGDVVIFDYDQDGFQDILISGYTGQITITKLYRNLGNLNFQEVTTPFPGLAFSAIAVGNIDNNPGGFESVIIAGMLNAQTDILHVYLNDNGVFTLHQSFPGIQQGEIRLGDFDNDGLLDMFVVGGAATSSSARAFGNNGDGTFQLRRTFNPGLAVAAAVLVDFNSDGKLDIIYSGLNNALGVEIHAFRNTTAMPYTVATMATPAEGGAVTGDGTYNEGSEVTVTATPASDFQFDHWLDEGGVVVSTQASYTFVMPSEDITLTAVFSPGMSVEDMSLANVVMYPNPTRGQLSIDLPNGVEVTGVYVTDIMGRKFAIGPQRIAALQSQPHHTIDMSRFSSGIYLVTVQSYDARVTKKVVKQ